MSNLSRIRAWLLGVSAVLLALCGPALSQDKPAGEIVFSKSSIDRDNPSGLTTEFKAGDYIYGLIRTSQPWSKIYKSEKGPT